MPPMTSTRWPRLTVPYKWKRLFALLADNPLYIALLVVIALATGLAEVGLMLIVTRLALNASAGGDRFDLTRNWSVTVTEALVLGVAVLIARFLISMLAVRVRAGLNYRVVSHQRMRLAEVFLAADRLRQMNEPSGTLQKVVAEFPTRGSSLLAQTTLSLASGLSLLTVVVSALIIDPRALIFMLGGLVVISIVLGPLKNSVGRRSQRAVDEQLEFANELGEIDGITLEIKAFGVEPQVLAKIRTLVNRDASSQMRLGMASGLMTPVYSFLAYALILVAVASASRFEFLSLDSFAAVVLIMLRAFTYGQDVQNGISALNEFLPFIDTMDRFQHRLTSESTPTPTAHRTSLRSIRLENLEFSYPGRPSLFSDLTIEIERGKALGIIGPSGAGKTTLIQLLLGLIEPHRGHYVVDDTEVSFLQYREFARSLAFVPQSPQLISGSIRDNILFFRNDIPGNHIAEAVEKSMLAEFLNQVPDGIDAHSGVSGNQLSGGQRQRIAIARALLEKPDFIILDEPTSALDETTQRGILEMLGSLKSETGLIIVTHSKNFHELFDSTITLI